MEDESAEFLVDSEDIDKKHVIKIQALIRGALIRKWMRDVKESFTDVVKDLEKNQSVCVEWQRSSICRPKLSRRQRNKQTKLQIQEEKTVKEKSHNNEIIASKKLTVPVPPINDNKAETSKHVSEQDDRILQLNTVETQTSFIEINTSTKNISEHTNEEYTESEDRLNTGHEQKSSHLDHLHLDVENELESVHTESLELQEIQSEPEDLFNQRLSTHADTRLNLSDVEDDISSLNENIGSGRDSDRSIGSHESNASTAFKTDTEHYNVTQVEDFQLPNSDRSRHSVRSAKSNKSNVSSKSSYISNTGIKALNNINDDVDNIYTDRDLKSARSDKSQDRHKQDIFEGSAGHLNKRHQFERPDSAQSQTSQRSDGRRTSERSNRDNGEHHNSDKRVQSLDSDRSDKTIKSYRSARSQDSHRSYKSKTSNRSVKEVSEQYHSPERGGKQTPPVSTRSQDSQKSYQSQPSYRSSKGDDEQLHSVEREENRSPFSDRSERSDRSKMSSKSHKSDISRHSDGSQKAHRSRTAHSPRQTRNHELKGPRPSSVSPVPVSRRDEEKFNVKCHPLPKATNHDSTTLTNVTSVWDSFNSFRESHDFQVPTSLPDNPDKLRELRKNMSMELLWVQQAINSRKNYLKLKNKM